jgi:LCP family protein required for cell wall assembly
VLAVVSTVTALSILTTSVVLWKFVHQIQNIQKVDAGTGPAKGSDQPVTYLIVGTDDRTGIPRTVLHKLHAEGEPCHCTDTMMLVHVSPKKAKAVIVSLPRDSLVTYPDFTDASGKTHHDMRAKLNAAYGFGGPRLTVKTVEAATGITVDHYLEVNFISFVNTVDALGGVEVCTPRKLRDHNSGLNLQAGTHVLDGPTSLKYVRARYVDPTADFGRMDRQQKFISSIIAKATSSGTLLNPIRLDRFVTAALGSVKTDPSLKAEDLVNLGSRLRNLSTSGVTFAQVPIKDPDFKDPVYGSSILWNNDDARQMFTDISDDRDLNPPAPKKAAVAPALTIPPGNIRVQVYNGSGVTGLGHKASDDLSGVGFAIAGAARTKPGSAAGTVIRYDPRYNESVKTLQAAVPGSTVQAVRGLGRTLQVVVGSSYHGATKVTAGRAPSASAAPTIQTRTAADNVCKKH